MEWFWSIYFLDVANIMWGDVFSSLEIAGFFEELDDTSNHLGKWASVLECSRPMFAGDRILMHQEFHPPLYYRVIQTCVNISVFHFPETQWGHCLVYVLCVMSFIICWLETELSLAHVRYTVPGVGSAVWDYQMYRNVCVSSSLQITENLQTVSKSLIWMKSCRCHD